jgi:GTPase SAR1 family protein
MYYQYQQQQPKQQQQPLQKLKCLVLGAAGAGKTSILRRHFRHVFEGTRVPTLGSDFYTGRMSLAIKTQTPAGTAAAAAADDTHEDEHEEHEENEEKEEVIVNIQMWDTPGRERYYMEKHHHHAHAHHHYSDHRSIVAASLSDSFFRNVSAIMLVYDMTSSTSFTQLLRWYADLMEMKNHAGSAAASESSCCSFPILIVGNKLDVLNTKVLRHHNNNTSVDSSSSSGASPRNHHQQRDIMGLKGAFRGHDFRYEYCATALLEQPPPQSSSSFNSQQQQQQEQDQARDNRHHHHQQHESKRNNNDRRHYDYDSSKTMPSVMKIYSSALHRGHGGGGSNDSNNNATNNRNSWTAHDEQYMNLDGSYLNSLLNSEDESHPDRDLVILWCMRNGLQHMQVSAATGEGVEEAMEMLVRLALENKEKQQQQQQQKAAAMTVAAQQQQYYIDQRDLPPDTTTTAMTASIMDTTTARTRSSTPDEGALNNASNGTTAPQGNGNHIIAYSSPATPSSSAPLLPNNDNNNNNNNHDNPPPPYQIQRRYPKLDLRERYASKEDQYKCFSCFLLGRIVMQWFRGF